MAATNCPETPRQRMIGMMYLVYLALLALNVSKDVLDAFAVVDETLVNSTVITNQSISRLEQTLAKEKASQGAEKVKEAEQMVTMIIRESDALVKYIEEIKSELLITVDNTDKNPDGTPKKASDIRSKDNISKVHNFMFSDGDMKTGRAIDLKNKIIEYKKKLLSVVKEDKKKEFDIIIGLDVEGKNTKYTNNDNKEESWEVHYFANQIMIAAYTLLNKTIGEVRNAQSTMINYAIGSTTADDFKFNTIQAKAIPVSQMVFQGDKYSAGIIVAAYDDRQEPEVYYKMGVDSLTSEEGATRLDGEGGLVQLDIPAGATGEHKYAGFIRVVTPDGSKRDYHFKDKYTVLKPSATVAADKMNVFYAGIENPVSVNAPVAPECINIDITGAGASYTKTGPGTYNITVPQSLANKNVTVNVRANQGGKTTTLCATEFRVKRVPDPVAKVGGSLTGGRVTKSELATNPFITAAMAQDFVYDLRWTIQSYQVTFIVRGMEEAPMTIQGAAFSEALKTKIRNAAPGTLILFSGIRATSPAGTRQLLDIVLRVR